MSVVHTERRGRVLTVTLTNPPLNFLNGSIMDELYELFLSLDKDHSVGAVVLTSGVKDVFISHYDVGEILHGVEAAGVELPAAVAGSVLRAQSAIEHVPGARQLMGRTPAHGTQSLLRYHQTCALMQRLNKVFIAAINGRALGGGSELALACDIRIMADGPYQIGQPEICVGIIPGGGGTQRLPRAVGHARALEIMLEGRPLSPDEAREIGYVHHLVDPENLLEFAAETAERLARRSPAAVKAIKHAVYGDPSLASGLHRERAEFVAAGSTKEARAAMRAYLEFLDQLEERGEDMSEENFAPWIEGTAFDFTG
ncbi:enoyl-CoA hydratase/isomerase family protein [Hoyosella subflava]|uniref:Putative enoyl-CoA hydratase/isomerase n=1 Tax=Hoyosella subflava (strain DSM 45089 / JCM 17490 / NBRC 109087 / DQS3-9A1) TaxID=443218 RepID=F6EGL1_HOYSD|nr:enoyl-CoA hydratase/isomerase family protein [Hoyosella subflava]AEF41064.1 putative enoyl-CoA hydratase/isomerase [Hoyosella subflava DQS3-9A1]